MDRITIMSFNDTIESNYIIFRLKSNYNNTIQIIMITIITWSDELNNSSQKSDNNMSR